jgi:hypothetical protein
MRRPVDRRRTRSVSAVHAFLDSESSDAAAAFMTASTTEAASAGGWMTTDSAISDRMQRPSWTHRPVNMTTCLASRSNTLLPFRVCGLIVLPPRRWAIAAFANRRSGPGCTEGVHCVDG